MDIPKNNLRSIILDKSFFKLFNSTNKRSKLVKQNIIGSFTINVFSVLISFLYVPLILNYLDTERYGIWLTLTSIVSWFTFFDLGLGNGLRNKLAESIAKNNTALSREYISTTYYYVSKSFLLLTIISIPLCFFLDWNSILNVTLIPKAELTLIAMVVFIFFFMKFVLGLLTFVLKGLQKTALSDLFNPIGNLISLIIIFVLTKTTTGSLFNLALTLSLAPVTVFLTASLFFYSKYKYLRPSFVHINKQLRSGLFNLGGKFFYIQIAALLLFSSANVIITQVLDPTQVTVYNIAYKYFTIPTIIFFIILNPLWSAFTDAYHKDDYIWCKAILKKLIYIAGVFTLGIIIMLIISSYFYNFWVGDKVLIPFELSLALSVFAIFTVIVAPFTNFVSGVGKLKLGLFIVTIKILIYIPIAVLLTKLVGVSGVVWATIIVNFSSIILEPMQTYKILNKTASGIWNE